MRRTERALLLDLTEDSGGFEVIQERVEWIPLSQIVSSDIVFLDNVVLGDSVTLLLSDWIARQKNLTDERAVGEENLERFVSRDTAACSDVFDTATTTIMCQCVDIQHARMIAAALNLTQGKV